MMVETMLESSQDFGMSNGALPQWKREVLQRRAARSRTAAAPPAQPPPPPPAPADDDEELRYGPGIVKRLQSRYLSLALRDAPRRRPSVLRRATSLEHLLDERPPPVPCARPTTHPRPPRPQSMAAQPVPLGPAQRRESVKRARSVDALSRLDTREDSRVISSSPPLPPPQPPRPPPFPARSARTPRRPTPLLRETERPPPDVVRSTLRKFESAPTRRAAPAARVSAVLRGLECPRTSTPEPRDPAEGPPLSPRTPSPVPSPAPIYECAVAPVLGPAPVSASASASISGAAAAAVPALVPAHVHVLPPTTPPPTPTPLLAPSPTPLVAPTPIPLVAPPPIPLVAPPPIPLVSPPLTLATVPDESAQDGIVTDARPVVGGARPVSRAALDGIARAGSTVRYVFEAPCAASHLPPLAATNPVLVGRARRIGVIRPMPARTTENVAEICVEENDEKTPDRLASPVPSSSPPPIENDPPPPSRIERKEPPPAALVEPIPRTPPDVPRPATPPHSPPPLIIERSPSPKTKLKSNTITTPLVNGHVGLERTTETKGAFSRIGAAGIERAWSGSGEKKPVDAAEKPVPAPWARPGAADGAGVRRGRAPPPTSTSVVFNFSNRKEVPDYIENDGIILRGSRKNRIKPGEPGVVVLRPEALLRSDSDSETETDGGPPSPCAVKFINDNVLINGKSSMPGKPNKDRISKLKLQFDDSLTRTFEYPSEVSLCEEAPPPAAPPAPPASPPAPPAPQLAESPAHAPLAANTHMASASLSRYTPSKTAADAFQLGVTRHDCDTKKPTPAEAEAGADAGAEGDARPCGADVARSWSESRTLTTDLLF